MDQVQIEIIRFKRGKSFFKGVKGCTITPVIVENLAGKEYVCTGKSRFLNRLAYARFVFVAGRRIYMAVACIEGNFYGGQGCPIVGSPGAVA